jgi:hypothetical protein
MKKSVIFRAFVFVVLAVMFSCDNKPLEQCVTESSACGTFQACCTVRQCYYVYDGKEYQCDGTDCTDAATQLANDMCNPSGLTGSTCFTEEEILDVILSITY